MATVKCLEFGDLDVFFEGGSESSAWHQFLNDLPVKVENAVTQVKVSANKLRDVLNQLTNGLMEISYAGGMLSCLTVQNTKDTTALLLQGQLTTSVPFYNFLYAFSYLFSLSIYAKAKEQDTASMTLEDLAVKHLGEDSTKRQFWEKSIKLYMRDVKAFIQLVSKEG